MKSKSVDLGKKDVDVFSVVAGPDELVMVWDGNAHLATVRSGDFAAFKRVTYWDGHSEWTNVHR